MRWFPEGSIQDVCAGLAITAFVAAVVGWGEILASAPVVDWMIGGW